jgi:hypothetical protein
MHSKRINFILIYHLPQKASDPFAGRGCASDRCLVRDAKHLPPFTNESYGRNRRILDQLIFSTRLNDEVLAFIKGTNPKTTNKYSFAISQTQSQQLYNHHSTAVE